MLSVFTLPFCFREPPFDWMIVCLILLNIVAVIAYITAYIEFKVKPPLPKYNIHYSIDYLGEFTSVRFSIVCFTLIVDAILAILYVLYVLANTTHLILFE